MARAVGEKFNVLLPHIVTGVEQVFAVQLNECEKGGQKEGYQHA